MIISIGILEIIGVTFGLLGVYLNYKNIFWGFLLVSISTIAYIFICWEQQLYGQMLMNFYYTIMNIVGVIQWTKKDKNNHVLAISYCTKNERIKSFIVLIFLWIFLFWIAKKFISSQQPLLDSLITAASYIGTWLLVKRKIDNWLWWVLLNILSIGLYIKAGLYITSFQFFILLIIAIVAFFEWRKKYTLKIDINNQINKGR